MAPLIWRFMLGMNHRSGLQHLGKSADFDIITPITLMVGEPIDIKTNSSSLP